MRRIFVTMRPEIHPTEPGETTGQAQLPRSRLSQFALSRIDEHPDISALTAAATDPFQISTYVLGWM